MHGDTWFKMEQLGVRFDDLGILCTFFSQIMFVWALLNTALQ